MRATLGTLVLAVILVIAGCRSSTARPETATDTAVDSTTTTLSPTTTGGLCSDCEPRRRLPVVEPLETDGLPDLSRSYHMSVADMNGDGIGDLVLTHHQNPCGADKAPAQHEKAGCPPPSELTRSTERDGVYLGTGSGSFEYSPEPLLSYLDRHGCVAADFNVDGRLDLFCGIGGQSGNATEKTDELFIAQPDGTFRNQVEAWELQDPARRSRLELTADFNRDGYPDLFTTAAKPKTEGTESHSRLWLNDGGRRFVPAPDWGLDGLNIGAGSRLSLAGNSDYVALLTVEEGVSAYANTGNRFEALPMPAAWQRSSTVILMDDIDDDGDQEFLVGLGPLGLGIFHPNSGESDLLEPGFHVRTIASGDFDGDGHRDVYLVAQGADCQSAEVGAYGGPNKSTGQSGGLNGRDAVAFGPSFSVFIPIPHTTQGCGDNAVATDTDGDGDDEIIVSNGWKRAWGPYFIVDMTSS